MIDIQLAFAPTANEQLIVSLQVADGTTIAQAIAQTDWLLGYPQISEYDVGIFAKKVTWQTLVCQGDRIEIYRPLTIDPIKRRQAKNAKSKT